MSDDALLARKKRRRRAALVVILLGAAGTSLWRSRHTSPAAPVAAAPAATDTARAKPSGPTERPKRVVPDSVRIKVEVINATETRGLARLATAWLRDQGFDVVSSGTAPEAERRDSTLVLDRSGHPAWAQLLAKGMGGAKVEARPDSLRYLDLTVLVGRSWRAPSQILYP